MRLGVLLLLALFGLTGCLVIGGGSPPAKTTVVVPQGATVTCTNANGTPCTPQQQ